MQKISVDTEMLNSGVTYFIFASKELDEINYRLKQIGNEMLEDLDLQTAPEYASIIEYYTELSKNIVYIKEIFESIIFAVSKAPEMYSDVEKRNIDRIQNIVVKNEKYQTALVNDKSLKDIIDSDKMTDGSNLDLINLIQKNLVDLSFSNESMLLNNVSNLDDKS